MAKSGSGGDEPKTVRIYKGPKFLSNFVRRLFGVEPDDRR